MSKEKVYNAEERENIIAAMDKLLHDLMEYEKYLKKIRKRIKKIDEDVKMINQYYHGEWALDHDNFYAKRDPNKKEYLVLAEDPIFDVTQGIYQEKLRLLKRIASELP